MAHKRVLFRSEAREKVLRGATALAEAARVVIDRSHDDDSPAGEDEAPSMPHDAV